MPVRLCTQESGPSRHRLLRHRLMWARLRRSIRQHRSMSTHASSRPGRGRRPPHRIGLAFRWKRARRTPRRQTAAAPEAPWPDRPLRTPPVLNVIRATGVRTPRTITTGAHRKVVRRRANYYRFRPRCRCPRCRRRYRHPMRTRCSRIWTPYLRPRHR